MFKITANGQTVLDSVDIIAEVENTRTALVKTVMVDVTGGKLILNFDPIKGETIVSNIRIRRQK